MKASGPNKARLADDENWTKMDYFDVDVSLDYFRDGAIVELCYRAIMLRCRCICGRAVVRVFSPFANQFIVVENI